jgi:hypothetical protein
VGTPRNFSNTASGASLNGTLAAGATTALLNNYSNFPAAPFTATISRNQADEEIVLVTAVTGSTVTLTRGFDGSSAQGHSAGATFEHTAVATDFREAQAHVNATAAHGTSSALVGVDDTQTLTAKTVKQLKALANASGAGVEADNESGAQGKLFRGLNAGVEKFFVDYLGNITGGSVTGTTGSLSGLLTAGGGVTVPTGKKVTLTDAPSAGTDAANKTYADARETAAKSYADTQVAAYGRHLGSGTAFPASPVEGDTFRRTDWSETLRWNGTAWRTVSFSPSDALDLTFGTNEANNARTANSTFALTYGTGTTSPPSLFTISGSTITVTRDCVLSMTLSFTFDASGAPGGLASSDITTTGSAALVLPGAFVSGVPTGFQRAQSTHTRRFAAGDTIVAHVTYSGVYGLRASCGLNLQRVG